MQFIDLDAQLEKIRHKIDARIKKVLDHGQFIMGPEVSELERALESYTNVKHCVTCANGTDALQLALMAKNIGPGDVVFTTSFSFFATAEVIALVGATPYFVDIDPATFNLCPDSLTTAIDDAQSRGLNARAVIVVDLFGLPADYERLVPLCENNNLVLIGDGAQSFGATVNGQSVAALPAIWTTSFFPAKPLGCFGDGGAIFTNDDNVADVLRSLRVHGKGDHKYQNIRVGMNSRLDTIQAAVLLEKLAIFDIEIQIKQEVADKYRVTLDKTFSVQRIDSQNKSALALFTFHCPDSKRQPIVEQLTSANIPYGIYYPSALTQSRAIPNFYSLGNINAENAAEQVLSIPMHAYLKQHEIEKIIGTLNCAIDGN